MGNLWVYKTGNQHGQYLIFTSRAALLNWARAATRLTDAEILSNTKKLAKIGDHFNLFTEVQQ